MCQIRSWSDYRPLGFYLPKFPLMYPTRAHFRIEKSYILFSKSNKNLLYLHYFYCVWIRIKTVCHIKSPYVKVFCGVCTRAYTIWLLSCWQRSYANSSDTTSGLTIYAAALLHREGAAIVVKSSPVMWRDVLWPTRERIVYIQF